MPIVRCRVWLCCCCALAAFAGEGDGGDDGGLYRRLADAATAAEHVVGSFRYTSRHLDDPDADPQVWHGEFAFHRPDRYRIRLQPADDEMFDVHVSDGEHHWTTKVFAPGEKPEHDLHGEDDERPWQAVMRFVFFERARIEEDFVPSARELADDGDDDGAGEEKGEAEGTAADGNPARYRVVFVPREGGRVEESVRVTVDLDAAMRVVRVRFKDHQDNLLTARVLEADYETEPDPSLFAMPEALR